MHVLEIEVRPTELDSFGHVNNARYLEYCEWARSDWSLKNGVSYDKCREMNVLPAVVEAKLRFQHEARLGDRLRIETAVELVHAARLLFKHEIRNQDNRRVLRAEISVVAFDLQARTFTTYPEFLVAAIHRDQEAEK